VVRPRAKKRALPADDLPTDGTRFFARLHALDFACPRCDRVYVIEGSHRYIGSGGWDPVTSTFQCKECGLTLQLGVLAYPVNYGYRMVPPDQYPLTVAEALKIRELARARLKSGYAVKGTPLNRIARPCTCHLELVKDPSCPVHRGDDTA